MLESLDCQKCEPILRKFLSILHDRLGEGIISVALFGSVARGTASELSDIDLLIIYRGVPKKRMYDEFTRCIMELRESDEYLKLQSLGYHPDPFPAFMDEPKLKSHPWLLLDVIHDGIILYDRDGILAVELEAVKRRMKELGTKRVVLEDGSWYWDLNPNWKPGESAEL